MGGDAGVTLAAVENALLSTASIEAQTIRRGAQERATRIIDQARAEAAALIERRLAAAERVLQLEEQERLADARAEARTTVLRAQRSVLIEARAAAYAAARELVGDPRYERLLKRLAAEARERLVGAGPVELLGATGGGLLARAGNRQIDYSLDALVDRCLRAVGSELEQLWR